MKVCEYCGVEHDDIAANYLFRFPDLIVELPRWKRLFARINPELCSYRGRTFIRATIHIPLVGHPDRFCWGIWAEVHPNDLKSVVARVRNGDIPTDLRGTLANELPPYPSTKGIVVVLSFSSTDQRPSVRFPSADKSALAKEMRLGYTLERQQEIIEIVDGARAGPNKSFKPNPLRGSA